MPAGLELPDYPSDWGGAGEPQAASEATNNAIAWQRTGRHWASLPSALPLHSCAAPCNGAGGALHALPAPQAVFLSVTAVSYRLAPGQVGSGAGSVSCL